MRRSLGPNGATLGGNCRGQSTRLDAHRRIPNSLRRVMVRDHQPTDISHSGPPHSGPDPYIGTAVMDQEQRRSDHRRHGQGYSEG
jgi:hypothetical protein